MGGALKLGAYRSSARPSLCVGDRVCIYFTLWEWLRYPSCFTSWRGYEMTVRSFFAAKHADHVPELAPCALLDIDDGGSIWMPVRFLRRSGT